jgi:hypothetical protein
MNFVGLDRYGLFLRTRKIILSHHRRFDCLNLVFTSVGNRKLNLESGLFPFLPKFCFHYVGIVKKPLERLRRRWDDDIKIDLIEV